MPPTVSSNKLLRNFTRAAHWAVLDRDAGHLERAREWARTAREWLAAYKRALTQSSAS